MPRDHGYPTLVDVAKRVNPNGTEAGIAEMLRQRNPILRDAPCVMTNRETTHQTQIRTGLPKSAWTKLGYGVEPDKSATRQITFNTGMLKSFSEIPADVVMAANQVDYYRRTEETAFVDSMNIEMARTMFYGSEKDEPSSFTGLTPYFSNKSAENGSQIIDASDQSVYNYGSIKPDNSANKSSIWIVGWGENSAYCIYPQGFMGGGLVRDNLGKYMSQTAPVEGKKTRDGRMWVYGAHYQWNIGFVMKDWRYTSRIVNLQLNALKASDPTVYGSANLPDMLLDAVNQIRDQESVKLAIYMPRILISLLDKHAKWAGSASYLKMDDIYGSGVYYRTVNGIPVHQSDALTFTESVVT